MLNKIPYKQEIKCANHKKITTNEMKRFFFIIKQIQTDRQHKTVLKEIYTNVEYFWEFQFHSTKVFMV